MSTLHLPIIGATDGPHATGDALSLRLLALWTHAAPDNVVPIWQQPSGAHDAYNTGDLVVYEGQVWRPTIDANVWPPGTGSLWELVP